MEVDDEVDSEFVRQFNCLNTSDKDVLIKELQGLLGKGTNLSEQTARFYLDMADWNLQAAICAYFDLQSSTKLPQMTFLQDVTIGEGESVPPNTSFIKTWRVENSGYDPWPEGCRLQHTGGERFGAPAVTEPLQCLPPRDRLDVSVQMVSPSEQGIFSSKWRMTTKQGHFFGDTIWVIIQVDSGGTLALMQQMVNLKELGCSPPHAPPPSPAHRGNSSSPAQSCNPFFPNKSPNNQNVQQLSHLFGATQSSLSCISESTEVTVSCIENSGNNLDNFHLSVSCNGPLLANSSGLPVTAATVCSNVGCVNSVQPAVSGDEATVSAESYHGSSLEDDVTMS